MQRLNNSLGYVSSTVSCFYQLLHGARFSPTVKISTQYRANIYSVPKCKAWHHGIQQNEMMNGKRFRVLKSLLNIFGFFHRTVAEMDQKQLGISNTVD